MLHSDYTERLRRLALGDEHAADRVMRGEWRDGPDPDEKTTALVRLACVIASGTDGPALFASVDGCRAAGIETDEVLEMVSGLSPVIGRERTREAMRTIRAVAEIGTPG